MNLLGSSLVLYLMMGAAVALATYLADGDGTTAERSFRVATAIPFWPLYVPVLLRKERQAPASADVKPQDEMAAAIVQVDRELQAAIASLRGWAEGVFHREKDRLAELRSAWFVQADRIREMDRLLLLPELAPQSHAASDPRLQQCEDGRRHNLQRLQQLRKRARDDLMATLASVRELVSMIHLAKFTGAPASRAEEIVAQIAAAVEGLSVVAAQVEQPIDEDAPFRLDAMLKSVG